MSNSSALAKSDSAGEQGGISSRLWNKPSQLALGMAPSTNENGDGLFQGGPSATLQTPNFEYSGTLFATGAKMAGRLNAASIPDAEIKSWLAERAALLSKKYEGTITRRETNRLAYVRWSLDRIEDARYGEVLDKLEGFIAAQERLGNDILALRGQLAGMSSAKRK
jgi:hypothetical protein